MEEIHAVEAESGLLIARLEMLALITGRLRLQTVRGGGGADDCG